MNDNLSSNELERLLGAFTNNNKYILNEKEHIKKYNKIRNLHSEIHESMLDYLFSDKYDLKRELNEISKNYIKNNMKSMLFLDSQNDDDLSIMQELFIYKNCEDIKPLTEIYIEENKFKNEEKVKLLESMNNSYVGLFRVIGADSKNGYITLKDVFKSKTFKVIDVTMSSTLEGSKKAYYRYARIITYEDISFTTGIHCVMVRNKELDRFIKVHKYSEVNSFDRCLMIYDISKRNKIEVTYNDRY